MNRQLITYKSILPVQTNPATSLRTYIRDQHICSDGRVFPLSYGGARYVVKRAIERMGAKLRPHDLRRFAATFTSKSDIPLQVVSIVVLRHKYLATTQRYLGKVD